MSLREGQVRLRHMLDHSREAVALIAERKRARLGFRSTAQPPPCRSFGSLEIVGEARSRTTEDERRQCPAVPWAQIVGLRNRLIHGDDAVDFDVLWQIVSYDLPKLVAELEPVLREDAS